MDAEIELRGGPLDGQTAALHAPADNRLYFDTEYLPNAVCVFPSQHRLGMRLASYQPGPWRNAGCRFYDYMGILHSLGAHEEDDDFTG